MTMLQFNTVWVTTPGGLARYVRELELPSERSG